MDPMETTSTPTPPPVTTPPPTEPTPPPSQTQQAVPPPSTVSSATETPSSTSSQNAKPNAIPTQQNSSNPNPQSSTIPIQQQPQTQPQPTLQQAQTRPQLNRVQPPPAYSQYSQHISSLPPPSTSTSLSSPATTTSIQRGGLAIGVPAHQQRPPSQPAPFSTYGQSSFSQQYGGVGRNPISVSDTSNTQARQPIQGMHTIGNFGSLMGSQLRPGGVPSQNQPRALQPSMRPQATPTNHSSPNQSFQSHALLRTPAMGSPSTPSPATPQGLQTHTQPWMTAAAQGKQMHPSYRPPIRPQNLQQRSHQPQQHHHPMSTVAQQAAYSQQQQQPMSQLHKPQDHYGPQHTLTRVPQSMPHQQQAQRGLGSGNPKTPTTTAQASALKSAPPNTTSDVDAGESSNHILSKRSIHELVSQIDPSEELDPEVEDILIEIAEDFVDSITSVGCSMAKHRKSTTLEAKDILLHLERNWNMTLPGFGGDEIKGYKKQLTNDIHKERLAMVKKSMVGPDAVNVKSSGGQAAGNPKARENA